MQGVRSSRVKAKSTKPEDTKDLNNPEPKQNDVFMKIIDMKDTIYTDQTGQFPHLSSKGNRYIMVAMHIDSNYIAMEAIKNRTERQMMDTYQRIVDRCKGAGLILSNQILDNKASAEFKKLIKDSGMEYELVPLGDYRRKCNERAIQIAKAHFIAIM